MLRKLKLKFVTLAMTALVALMVVVVAAMNIINYVSVVDEADSVLSFISENQGDFFQSGNKFNHNLPTNMSP